MEIKVNRHLLKFSRLVHIYLSIALLFILLFFAVTGIFLNHPDWFERQPVERIESTIFPGKLPENGASIPPPPALIHFLQEQHGVNPTHATFEVDDNLLFVDQQKPGKSISIEMDLESGEIEAITSHRGLIATLNELHKGRHAKQLWRWLIDISAVLTVIFSLSGLLILLPQKKRIGKVIVYTLLGLPIFIFVALI